ncbi:hypothetical protein [Allohahella sp. A8]|uniref:hypothetical protein n=1 Tax=Allohahella sp. A8 TaxID=3141461 RepID=UPI003A805345
MNAACVEQLLAECHPDWTGFSAELMSAAVRSSLGRRTLLNKLAPRFRALQRLDKSTKDVSPGENYALLSRTSWLPAGTLMSRLTTLGACFYLQQICAEIRRQQVAEWKAVLGAEHYRLMIQNVRSCISENLSLPNAQLSPVSQVELLSHCVETRQSILAGYGLFTMLAVAKTLAPSVETFDELSMRLGSLFPPNSLTQWLETASPAEEKLCEQTSCILALWRSENSASLKA